jgi:hypothetical protein
MNEYGVCASGSWGQPLPEAFASRESLLMSVGRIEFVTSQRDVSKVLGLDRLQVFSYRCGFNQHFFPILPSGDLPHFSLHRTPKTIRQSPYRCNCRPIRHAAVL